MIRVQIPTTRMIPAIRMILKNLYPPEKILENLMIPKHREIPMCPEERIPTNPGGEEKTEEEEKPEDPETPDKPDTPSNPGGSGGSGGTGGSGGGGGSTPGRPGYIFEDPKDMDSEGPSETVETVTEDRTLLYH